MTIGIYNPKVRAEALKSGITELQAYRKLQAREILQRREADDRRARINKAIADEREEQRRRGPVGRLLDRVINGMVSPDWNHY